MNNRVCVVLVRLDETPEAVDTLAPEELERARRFMFTPDRRRFLAAHVALRAVMAHAVGMSAASIRFASTEWGKPYAVGLPLDLRFNLSHSGERALIALTIGREVGIDIEAHRDVDALALARSAFSAAERAALLACDREERLNAFYRCWTRKESFIKARGDGLSFALDGFDVSMESSPTVTLLACPASPPDMRRWTIAPLAAEPGYSAALTIEKGSGDIVCWPTAAAFLADRGARQWFRGTRWS